MLFKNFKAVVIKSGLFASALLAGAAAHAQIALTAGPATAAMPDGSSVPMWGYTCGAASDPASGATCAPLNPHAGGGWSPVVITVPVSTSGPTSLKINLTNNLAFPAAKPINFIPTSLTIVGQLGGGLGLVGTSMPSNTLCSGGGTTCTDSPDHTNAQSNVTWPIAGPGNGTGTPPAQAPRLQSFGTEVTAVSSTTTATCSAAADASPVSGCATLTWSNLKPGTYLIESGTHPSIQGPMGLYGVLVVTTAPTAAAPGTAYTAGATPVTYSAELPLLFSEIDPVQNNAVNTAVNTVGFSETMVWSGLPGGCGNAASSTYNQCYPPAVNYTPTYYTVNGVAFNRANASASLFAVTQGTAIGAIPQTGTTGAPNTVLVRLVNAGLKMHVPSIIGAQTGVASDGTKTPSTNGQIPAGMTLIAEDGNVLPGVPRVQSEVFMAAGKTMDVMINVPPSGAPALPIFDRQLSLSGNAINRDAGMLAYIGVNGSGMPAAKSLGAAQANADTYPVLVAGQTFTLADPAKGVIANDVNVYGVALASDATHGTVTLNTDGTFTYAPGAGSTATSDSFSYCANGAAAGTAGLCTTVTLGASAVGASAITCSNPAGFASMVASTYTAMAPGLLTGCHDSNGLPLSVDLTKTPTSAGTLVVNADGSFTLSGAPSGPQTINFTVKNSHGDFLATTATVVFPTGSGLQVTVLDGYDHKTVISDYRWVIEEDRTFYQDPNCTTNPLPSGCPDVGGGVPPFFGTNFHTSFMPLVATGCTGSVSCGAQQTVLGQAAPQSPVSWPKDVVLDPTKRYYISVLPGDAADPFNAVYTGIPCGQPGAASPTDANAPCSIGHGMGGAPIAAGQAAKGPVTILTEPSPYPPGKLSVLVFEDDYPLNGEHDAGGGVDVLAANEPGLGGFQITLQDDAGATGDATGTPTYDMFNQPLTNALAGTIDPITGLDACPVSPLVSANVQTKVTASLAKGSPTFTLANVPSALTVGATLQDAAGAIPEGTTVLNIDTTDPTKATITMSAPAVSKATSDSIRIIGVQKGITGMIVTCPKFESDGQTLSPLAGQALVNNLYPGRYGVQANEGADRFARGEEWLQTNTLDGQKAHDSFIRIGETGYFQEFGPAGYHVTIGFANPKIINARLATVCASVTVGACNNEVKGHVTTARMSRTPDERLYGSGTRDSFAFTQCYVAIGDPDGATFAFTKCDENGNFDFQGLPAGNFKLVTFDQWNDQILDGISIPVNVNCQVVSGGGAGLCQTATTGNQTLDVGEVATHQWQANIYTRTFIDLNGNGVSDKDPSGNDTEPGLALASTNIRFRDGSFSNFNNTDLNGYANFNEVFPLFNWYVIETDTTRYKSTGVHVVYDAGGPVDGSNPGGGLGQTCASATPPYRPCGSSAIGHNMADTYDPFPLPPDLSLPGSVYCAIADCTGLSIANGPKPSTTDPTQTSTGRIDVPFWWGSYGWQGYSGQNSFLEFGKKPFAAGETGGIHGHVVYASTRPFDDPGLNLQTSWEPLVAHVTVNLYQEGVAADGITPTLTLIDTTQTSSFDDWAQGFRTDAKGNFLKASDGGYIPNISCPGQDPSDPFMYGLNNQPNYLDFYNAQHGGTPAKPLAYKAQYKCYDGMHNWNQLQPAPYDGMYSFPSVTALDPTTGKPIGTNCLACVTNPDSTDPYRYGGSTTPVPYVSGTSPGMPMLPPGKYVVEVVVPPGYQLVKEEDKNILIGDNYIAPVAVQFPGLAGSVYILPDQAQIGAFFNANNAQNSTTSLGRTVLPSHEGDTGSVESYWPCVGAPHTVPDYISLFPGSFEVAPFAGATRPLCDRKEILLTEQSSALAKFYIFTDTHIAAHFSGQISDDFTGEFDPFSPSFGEKFAPAYLPVSIKDWTGNEISRVYTDGFGVYNGLSYSTWEVNPPNPTGYGPTMMVTCMNDSGMGATPDKLFQPGYSQFCYELAFMPGRTGYFDTPVTPTAAFSEGYNHPDCEYPDATPAIQSVVNADPTQPQGPWVNPGLPGAAATDSITITNVAQSLALAGPTVTAVRVNGTSISGAGSIVCDLLTGCASGNQNTRNNNMAALITAAINANTASNGGYSATRVNNVVTVAAPAGTAANGATLTVALPSSPQLTVALSSPTFAGGTPPTAGAMKLTITALGDQMVDNYGYSGPSAPATGSFNLQKVKRHFGFGSGPSSASANCAAGQPCVALLGSDGRSYPLTLANATDWTDAAITATVTTTSGGNTLPNCAVPQQAFYGGSPARCGQLIITTAGGRQSIDTVTVTVGGKKPTTLAPGQSIQSAIDQAAPGDMIIVPQGVYNEMVLMWKPVRLQGVGAASAIIDANTQPSGKLLDPWRKRVNCLFGLTSDGRPRTNTADLTCATTNGTAWTAATGAALSSAATIDFPTMIVDRLPFEAILGWDATLNGNLAEQLIEPSLMGAYEGAAITVLGKGVKFASGTPTAIADAFGATTGATYPGNTLLLSSGDCSRTSGGTTGNPYPTNFYCNPSSIDGLAVRNSSQGGGGIFVHAYAHNLQIANNRIYNNMGTLAGGITVGQGEHPDPNTPSSTTTFPPSCLTSTNGLDPNESLPYCFNQNVNIHNNAVRQNSSLGDELFSSTPAGAGGVVINSGADNYTLANNWVCGNVSTGDGGGVSHVGFIVNGTIKHNSILFNQSTNPTIATNGGGLLLMGAPDADPTTCGVNTDQDCVPPPGSITPSDGVGRNIVVDANLILGNAADSGSGGGLRLQHVNGTDVTSIPLARNSTNCSSVSNCQWNSVSVTNNIIANNVAGWDGAGVSLLDSLIVNLVNNTIVHNDATASSGTLFNSLFAPLASAPSTAGASANCFTTGTSMSSSCPQVSGVSSVSNSLVLQANLPAGFQCPAAWGAAKCAKYSAPLISNDAIWQNRSFIIGVGNAFGDGVNPNTNQQHVVKLYNASFNGGTPTTPVKQTTTGQCDPNASYWEIGVRGDTSPGNHSGGLLAPVYSILSDAADYPNTGVSGGDPKFVASYCNGARTPPENGGGGYLVPPGTNETTAIPAQVFSLAPSAVVDESNNWINMRWGPLSLTNPSVTGGDGNWGGGAALADLHLQSGSAAIDFGTSTNAPGTDFYGTTRPQGPAVDIGAVEFVETGSHPIGSVTGGPLNFGNVLSGQASTMTLTVHNTGTAALPIALSTLTAPFSRPTGAAGGTCGASVNANATCTIVIRFAPTAAGSFNASLTVTSSSGVFIEGSPVAISGTGAALLVSPGTLSFGGQVVGSTSGAQTLTVNNASGGARQLTITVTAPFVRATGAGAGTCPTTAGATVASGGSCTINVLYSPTVGGASNGTVTITADGGFGVANSPVALSGTGAVTPVAGTLRFARAGFSDSATLGYTGGTGFATVNMQCARNPGFTNPGVVNGPTVTGSPGTITSGLSRGTLYYCRIDTTGPATTSNTVTGTSP